MPSRGPEVAEPRSRGLAQRPATSESGFTLAAVIVLASILMIFAAYTIPRQWSTIMKREREQQTIFAMQQYAKAIDEFKLKNNTYPTSPQQLKDARLPRMIRGLKGEYVDPLTGEVDWLVIPQSAAAALPQHALAGNPNSPPGVPPPAPIAPPIAPATDTSGTSGTNPPGPPALPGVPIKDYAGGPFIGVRPNAHGKALNSLFGADTYETWVYTSLDYDSDKALRIAGAGIVFR